MGTMPPWQTQFLSTKQKFVQGISKQSGGMVAWSVLPLEPCGGFSQSAVSYSEAAHTSV